MKIEIIKKTNPDGDIFYIVLQNDRHMSGFWVGNHIKNQAGLGEETALSQAQEYYDRLKAQAMSDPIVEIIQSETIEPTIHEHI